MSDNDQKMTEGLILGWRHTIAHSIGAGLRHDSYGRNAQDSDMVTSLPTDAERDASPVTGIVGFLVAIPLFPFFVLFRTVTGPFASDLRWPRPTRIVSVLGLCSLLAWTIDPDFKAMRNGAPDMLVAAIEWGWIGAMILGIATIPAAIFMLNRRS